MIAAFCHSCRTDCDVIPNFCYIALPCTESEVRLIINRVQICHNEVWGYVCEDNDWTDDDASVVCRELGFLPQGAVTIMSCPHFP